MAKGIKVCKVCGREYESCHTLRPNLNSSFRWQDVACCEEHGAEYLRQVMIARGELKPDAPEVQRAEEESAASEQTAVIAEQKKRGKKRRELDSSVSDETE